MGILNRPSDGLLSVLIAVRRALIAYGPRPSEDLIALCAPSAAVADAGAMVRRTLVRWRQLGFFDEINGQVDIAAPFRAIGEDDLASLRASLLHLVLTPDNNPGVVAGTEEASDDEQSRAADFTRATVWLLAQDPYRMPTSWSGVDQTQNEQRAEPRPFINDTRWQGFIQWSKFLGVAWPPPRTEGWVVPNPAFAVRTVFDRIFGEGRECPQEQFFARLAEAIPVLDGGSYRRAIEKTLSGIPALRINEISISLSLALLHLESAGEIGLAARADAPRRLLLGRRRRELRPVSHVVRLRRP